MAELFDTLLLLALPASGKSEVRTYLSAKNPEQFHMGPTVQLDDYPYVVLQLRIDEELDRMGLPRLYHQDDGKASNGPFLDPAEWGALIELLNEDYHELRTGVAERPKTAFARRLFERLDTAVERAGGAAKIRPLPADVQDRLAATLESEARAFFEEKAANCPTSLNGKTVVIEFARGGPEGASLPLPRHYGYAGALAQLSSEILERAAILYIWVSPEESRRKNRARARPDGQGSILFHGTPESVMRKEYGLDDMEYLIGISDVAGTLRAERGSRVYHVPVARFDNREDKTTFLRRDQATWTPAEITAIHSGIKGACDQLWATYAARK